MIRACKFLCFYTISVFILAAEKQQPVTLNPLVRAHAHNDYYHKRPLLDALASGFCSVEADVFLKDDTLLVGHFRFELRKVRSLEALYLKPLAAACTRPRRRFT